MESAGMLPAVPAMQSEVSAPKPFPANPNVRQYLLHLATDSRRLCESEVGNAVVGVTPRPKSSGSRAPCQASRPLSRPVVDVGAAAQGPLTRGEIDQLRLARENYEELEAGFAALRRAIEVGEVPLEGVRHD